MSMAVIVPPAVVKVMTVTSRPAGATRIAGAPSTTPVRACLARLENASACLATG